MTKLFHLVSRHQNNKMYRFACVLLLCVSALQAVPYEDCGSKGNITSISVTNCLAGNKICIFKRKTNVTTVVWFHAHKDVTAATSVVHAVLSPDVVVPFPIPRPDPCADEDSGMKCPLMMNEGPHKIQSTLPVKKSYPRISGKARWQLKDQDGEDIICIEIPVKIE